MLFLPNADHVLQESSRLELWGGVECSIVRIGENFRRQLDETGHLHRASDLELISDLGIRTLRYPVLWEMISPKTPDVTDWHWQDARMHTLQRLSITPIAGLLHHGSGPRYTNLLDPDFPNLLASHAANVATRYPWINCFTPVNEPLTTARFSALYGHWYPHARDSRSFLRALINQCAGVLRSMRAIRRITPAAKLIQTEDLGKTFSTPLLSYQAGFENERRWLSFDLLCGRVDRFHPLYDFVITNGILEQDLAEFLEHPCPPDIIGVNHYLTSERFLDERHSLYSPEFHGGNGCHEYADVEAVRMNLPMGSTGLHARMREVWDRYKLPLAVTEAHHGSTRDDQVRWLADVWRAAEMLKEEGANVQAVTVWSMFGAKDWNSLLTRRVGFYEPGAFDMRSKPPRPTVLARAAADLAREGVFKHPVLDGPGWWQRADRFYMPQVSGHSNHRVSKRGGLAIAGATGTLGRALGKICELRGLDYVPLSRAEMDITDADQVAHAIQRIKPWAVINAAGFVRGADVHRERERCFRENSIGPECLARLSARHGLPFVTFSSDLVFDGRLERPYDEPDSTCPSCDYGMSKAEAESRVRSLHPDALIVRTSTFFGPWDAFNIVHRTLSEISEGRRVSLSTSEIVSPTYLPDLCHAVLDLLVDGEKGIWHLANTGPVSWFDLGREVAERADRKKSLIYPEFSECRNTALTSGRGQLMPSLEDALSRFFRDSEKDWGAVSQD